MLSVMVASCARDPLVACNVSCESPAGVLEEEATVNVCDEFAPIVIGDAGVVDVPAGRPDIATEADPLNPFDPTIETVTGILVPPRARLTEVGENRDVTDTAKSGTGGGGGVVDIPPPQLIIRDIAKKYAAPATETLRPVLIGISPKQREGMRFFHRRVIRRAVPSIRTERPEQKRAADIPQKRFAVP